MKRNIIGEGAYGCVHKPSIHCTTPPKPEFDYKKYVSKIMKTENAEKELSEFVTISKLDPENEYHLGTPILCKPDLNEETIESDIKKCKYIKSGDIKINPDKYSLLVLKYGGPDLKMLCTNYSEDYFKEIKVDNFWLEVHHLIKGLKFFKENGIVHNDIKPQNILFNYTNGKLKYIDFGLMRTKKEIFYKSKINENYLGIYHWSYPFDCGLMNMEDYNKFKTYNKTNKKKYKNELSELIISNSKINTLKIPINNPQAFNILFTYLNPEDKEPNSATKYAYINSFFDGFETIIKEESYYKVLELIIDSIDVFGLGFSLQYIANCFKRHNAISLESYTKLSGFFNKMYSFNPLTRVIDIDLLLQEYENILLEMGVLTRLHKSFLNNDLIDKPPAPPIIMNEIKNDSKSPSQKLSAKLEEYANKDAFEIVVNCGENKEFNPISKRCVKKCKNGYIRNDKFKCKKQKTAKSVKKITRKCSENKELNHLTNRCVKKCKEGFIRNDKFTCIKNKTRKIIY
jgi:serine/threonine protein kinase